MKELIKKTINPSRLMLARLYVGAFSLLGIFLGAQDYASGYIVMPIAYLTLVIFGPITIILSYRVAKCQNLPAYLAVGFTFIAFVIGSFTQLDSMPHLVWAPASPIMYFYLTNLRTGLILTVISYATLLIGYENFTLLNGVQPVELAFFYQANAAYFLTSLLSYFYEADRSQQESKLFRQSEYDVLTKILNRRGMGRVLDQHLKQFDRYGISFSIILCDLDDFKQVNDRFGHTVGDSVLIELVGLLERNLRSIDIIGRWGGEEFIILTNATSAEDAGRLAEKLRLAVERHTFSSINNLSASFGIAEIQRGETIEDLFNHADKALYGAKRTKNTVEFYAVEALEHA